MSWEDNKKWSDIFIPEIKTIVGPKLLSVASASDDQLKNTDLITLCAGNFRIPCRIRRYGYLDKYRTEFTLRYALPSGTQTEFAKMMMGWGDWFFYGHSDKLSQNIEAWMLIDLFKFRIWVHRFPYQNNGTFPGKRYSNGHMDSDFFVFDIKAMPSDIVLDSFNIQ